MANLMQQIRSQTQEPYARNSQSLPASLKSASIGELNPETEVRE